MPLNLAWGMSPGCDGQREMYRGGGRGHPVQPEDGGPLPAQKEELNLVDLGTLNALVASVKGIPWVLPPLHALTVFKSAIVTPECCEAGVPEQLEVTPWKLGLESLAFEDRPTKRRFSFKNNFFKCMVRPPESRGSATSSIILYLCGARAQVLEYVFDARRSLVGLSQVRNTPFSGT